MTWTVVVNPKVQKRLIRLTRQVQDFYLALFLEMESHGPVRGDWPHYGKLGPNRHHCHVRKGRPTYVAVWDVVDHRQGIIEVIYVGTHEKAPY